MTTRVAEAGVAVDGLLSTGGEFVVAGSLTAEVVLAYYNHGRLIVGGDLRTTILYESEHLGSVVLGAADTQVALISEMRGVEYHEDDRDRLLDLVRPELAEEVRSLVDEDGEVGRGLDDLVQDHALARTLLRPVRSAGGRELSERGRDE